MQQYHDEVATTKQLIEDSGTTREVMASAKFSKLLEEMDITVPLKNLQHRKMIPAFGKNDKAYQQLQDMYPEHKNLWNARTAVKSHFETRAKRFIDSVHNDGTISVPLKY